MHVLMHFYVVAVATLQPEIYPVRVWDVHLAGTFLKHMHMQVLVMLPMPHVSSQVSRCDTHAALLALPLFSRWDAQVSLVMCPWGTHDSDGSFLPVLQAHGGP